MTLIEQRAEELNTRLCVGIDPHPEDVKTLADLEPWCIRLAQETAPYALCFKVNIAFFEAHGSEGMKVLERVTQAISQLAPVLLDAKRGDISSTAAAYAEASFKYWGAQGLTVSPYLGPDTLDPFLAYPEAGLFVLCHTSNPGAPTWQRQQDQTGKSVYESVAECVHQHPEHDRLGLVVGATQPEAVGRVRTLAPQSWLLCPGIGSQGGNLSELVTRAWGDRGRVLVSASRSIARAQSPADAARDLRDQIVACAPTISTEMNDHVVEQKTHDLMIKRLAHILLEAECVLFGEFTLKSGLKSPIYIDLRRLAGHPIALKIAVDAYHQKLEKMGSMPDWDPPQALAGLPLAGLPLATGLAIKEKLPLCYPRPPKAHGTRSNIEGGVEDGVRLLLIDDLATRGASALEVLPSLRERYQVNDLLVLIDRQSGASSRLAQEDVKLHAVVTLSELLDEWERSGAVDQDRVEEVRSWSASS